MDCGEKVDKSEGKDMGACLPLVRPGAVVPRHNPWVWVGGGACLLLVRLGAVWLGPV